MIATDKELKYLLDELNSMKTLSDHQIPYYAFADNEAANDMDNRLRDLNMQLIQLRKLIEEGTDVVETDTFFEKQDFETRRPVMTPDAKREIEASAKGFARARAREKDAKDWVEDEHPFSDDVVSGNV
nr:hypothetical protein 1 [Legionellales bacterium]